MIYLLLSDNFVSYFAQMGTASPGNLPNDIFVCCIFLLPLLLWTLLWSCFYPLPRALSRFIARIGPYFSRSERPWAQSQTQITSTVSPSLTNPSNHIAAKSVLPPAGQEWCFEGLTQFVHASRQGPPFSFASSTSSANCPVIAYNIASDRVYLVSTDEK